MVMTEAITAVVGGCSRLFRARVVRTESNGDVCVIEAGAEKRVLTCQVLILGPSSTQLQIDEEVLVASTDDHEGAPIILGRIGGVRDHRPGPREAVVDPPSDVAEDLTLDIRTITIEAGESLVLRCGEASITITRDGKIVLRGQHILSRAKGTQRIKGATVAIN